MYFGADPNHAGCGTRARPCAKELTAAEAALLAGVVANPSAFDPIAHPEAATRRRNIVLAKMLEQGKITRAEYDDGTQQALPGNIVPPSVDTKAPYFTTWVSQQLVEQFGARRAFEGGLRVRTTLDLDFQNAAQRAIDNSLPNPDGPAAAMVAIDNQTGEVRALVNSTNYRDRPFNLATQGERQPGSTVKPFILAEAHEAGHTGSGRSGRRASASSTCPAPAARRSSSSTTSTTPTPARATSARRSRSPTTPSSPRPASRPARRRSPG